jgi:hypothetical protein
MIKQPADMTPVELSTYAYRNGYNQAAEWLKTLADDPGHPERSGFARRMAEGLELSLDDACDDFIAMLWMKIGSADQ